MREHYKDEQWLRDKYLNEEWSATGIAKFCGVGYRTIYRWLDKFGIERRNRMDAQKTKMRQQEWGVVRYKSPYYTGRDGQTIQVAEEKQPQLKWNNEETMNDGDQSFIN